MVQQPETRAKTGRLTCHLGMEGLRAHGGRVKLRPCLVTNRGEWGWGLGSLPLISVNRTNGVGCHFLLQCMKVKSESEVAQSCLTLVTPWTTDHQAPPSKGFFRQKYWSGVPLPSPNRTKVAHNEAGPQMSHHRAEKGNLDNSEFIRGKGTKRVYRKAFLEKKKKEKENAPLKSF